MKLTANQFSFEVVDAGDRCAPAVVLINGLGHQLTYWPSELIDALLAAGYRVIRFDNRDTGLTQSLGSVANPNFIWFMVRNHFGLPATPPYTLQDMADDVVGILDGLAIDAAHVVGISMGAMIGQRLALAAPGRVLSLASVMGSSGAAGLPGPSLAVIKRLRQRPPKEREALLDHMTAMQLMIGSPAWPADPATIRRQMAAALDRAHRPEGFMRQVIAIAADKQRAGLLGGIRVPTLVVHGKADPLIPFPAAEDTQRRIPGARLLAVDGMGHDLPPGLCPYLAGELAAHFANSTVKTHA